MRHVPRALLLGLVLAAALPAARGDDPEDDRPWDRQPFLGLSVRDTNDGLVVGWIAPGPLGGRGFTSESGIQRGDNVVSVDGAPADAEAFQRIVRAKAPGEAVVLVLRRSPEASAESAVPRGGAGGEPFTVEVEVGSRDAWSGTIRRGLGGRTIAPAVEGAFEREILDAAARHGLREGLEGVGGGLDVLLDHLRAVQDAELDPNALGAVVRAFRRPLSVDAVEAEVYEAVRRAGEDEGAALEALLVDVLDLEPSRVALARVLEREPGDLEDADVGAALRLAGEHLEDESARDARASVLALVAALRQSVYIYDDDADRHVRVINDLAGPRAASALAWALLLARLAPGAWEARAAGHADGPPLDAIPETLAESVEGEVLWIGEDALGNPAVVGGRGPNTYDMDVFAAVYDVGGDDVYLYGNPESEGFPGYAPPPPPLRVVIDLAGNDRHEAHRPFDGPATAVYGLSWLDDRGGDDVYRTGHAFSVAAGLLGIGVLRDRSGDDRYECVGEDAGWGQGCGFWGAGLLFDDAGHDVYRGEKLVQGVGGPRGLGLILDRAGRDLYVANGPHHASLYGTPAVYVGMSQGFGIGIRGYASGGLGAIYDLAGHDRYEAGEFSQAGGYYFGMGILHDVAGNDLYHGNRYGQAFAAHQAVGVLVDDAGDDTYWSMTAASQAGTWDESIGLLLDRAGNDAYRCDGLGQGGASMQAIAVLLDLGGDDRYTGAGASVQGRGGGNQYHYDEAKVFSFSALLDLGGGRDVYSADRGDDSERATGESRDGDPGSSPLYGLFVDR